MSNTYEDFKDNCEKKEKEEKRKLLYNLDLHESLCLGICCDEKIIAMRVAGGWIYEFSQITVEGGITNSTCFVPFNNEFQKC